MNNPKWGTKRQCQECGARFYDLKRAKVACPKCDAPFKVEPPAKPKRARAAPVKVEAAPPPEKKTGNDNGAPESAEDKALKEVNVAMPDDAGSEADKDEDEDENAFEDASELGKDEDDMAEVIEGSRKVDES